MTVHLNQWVPGEWQALFYGPVELFILQGLIRGVGDHVDWKCAKNKEFKEKAKDS